MLPDKNKNIYTLCKHNGGMGFTSKELPNTAVFFKDKGKKMKLCFEAYKPENFVSGYNSKDGTKIKIYFDVFDEAGGFYRPKFISDVIVGRHRFNHFRYITTEKQFSEANLNNAYYVAFEAIKSILNNQNLPIPKGLNDWKK